MTRDNGGGCERTAARYRLSGPLRRLTGASRFSSLTSNFVVGPATAFARDSSGDPVGRWAGLGPALKMLARRCPPKGLTKGPVVESKTFH
jgi:hypothetical protein